MPVVDAPIVVLKFGGSVLRSEDSVSSVVHEIYRWVRSGHRVVAVVSALGGVTDALLGRARGYHADPEPGALATLLATGEQTSVALVALGLNRAGIASEVADAARLGLKTSGGLLDAEPTALDAASLRAVLRRVPVVVAPGFVGLDGEGRTTLLGRGGSDYTALFIAHTLRARCRLVKDVRGLYERDPARPGPLARVYRSIHWSDAQKLDGRIVQHKAVRFAQDHGLWFEVGAANAEQATLVGGCPSTLGETDGPVPGPLRVALLGLGSVGLGVYRELASQPELFEVTRIAVRNVRRAADTGVPHTLLTPSSREAVESGADAVVELVGGLSPARELLELAIERGCEAVTANKAVIARHGASLAALARVRGVTLAYSAAVGGVAPVLETIRSVAAGSGVQSVVGVLNGTSSFVLDRVAKGVDVDQAAREAFALGLAEADPTLDLNGSDAADKLVICAHAALGEWIDRGAIDARGVDAVDDRDLGEARAGRGRLRLVARLHREGTGCTVRVGPELITAAHPLQALRDDECGVAVGGLDGSLRFTSGRGAGRWPTTEAVVADLLDLVRSRNESSAGAGSETGHARSIEASLQEVAS